MKGLFIAFAWMFTCLKSQGEPEFKRYSDKIIKQNMIKINMLSLPFNAYSFQYERPLKREISFAVAASIRPKSKIPFLHFFERLLDQGTNDYVKTLRIGGFAITPEFRFYFGKGLFQGFYMAPFMHYATYRTNIGTYKFSYSLDGTNNSNDYAEGAVTFTGSLSFVTAGALLGAQYKLAKLLYLDWWIIGPQFGFSKGKLSGEVNLSSEEQNGLLESLNDLDQVPLIRMAYKVTNKGAEVSQHGGWVAIRTGLCIGYRF